MIVNKDDYILDVDIEKTKSYYKSISLCECPNCRNFYMQAKENLPLLTQFLLELGVDISRPDEIDSYDIDGEIAYSFVGYTVIGKIIKSGEYEIDISDGDYFLNIVINNSYIPNEQITDKYFTVIVYGIYLPWKLTEPYLEKTQGKNIISRIKAFFKRG